MIRYLLFFLITISVGLQSNSQQVQISKEELIALTPEWKGERFPDGRPKVPDDIIRRMKPVTIEEAWAILIGAGYRYQIADGWEQIINPDSVLVGRAYTTTFMPGRPDVWKAIDSMGKKEGRLVSKRLGSRAVNKRGCICCRSIWSKKEWTYHWRQGRYCHLYKNRQWNCV